MDNWSRWMRSGKINPMLLGVLGVLAVVAIVYWVFFSGPGAPPPPPPDENRPDVSFYHYETHERMTIPYLEYKELIGEEGRYEYPPGSGKFEWIRIRPGDVKMP